MKLTFLNYGLFCSTDGILISEISPVSLSYDSSNCCFCSISTASGRRSGYAAETTVATVI